MSCASICASIKKNTNNLQYCLDLNPVGSFDLAIGDEAFFAKVYQADGGLVTASGVFTVSAITPPGLNPRTVVELMFFNSNTQVGSIAVLSVIAGTTYGFTELTPFDNISIRIFNGSLGVLNTAGTLHLSLVVNAVV